MSPETAVSSLDRWRSSPTDAARPKVWGCTATELHDAYWRSHGVACVRRGSNEELPPGADVYLLLDPEQGVVFHLGEIATELQWTRAAICRLRVVDSSCEPYVERVVVGAEDRVQRIERVYAAQSRVVSRLTLTDHRGLAAAWQRSASHLEGWRAIRDARSRRSVAKFEVRGWSFRFGEADDDARLLARLVNEWSDPERALEGIVRLGDGIYGLGSDSLPDDVTLVGPLWLGSRGADERQPETAGDVLIGPQCVFDSRDERSVRLRPIAEIFAPEARRKAATAASNSWYPAAKRAIDVLFSAAVLLALLPLLVAVAIAVVADDGFPIFFGHQRQTKGGRVFRCWKFRTMRRNAEALAKELAALNVCDGPQFFIQNDPRVTRVGAILRRTHLDELPQFWNVLLGDMSLVGPRPSPDGENQFCPAWRELRLSVRPGITGLWQVARTREPGRDFQEWIRYDVEYVQRASLSLDFQICVRTLRNMVSK
ncbi:MAG: sugar transferase [Phycisphaerales bacterium]